MQKTRTASGIKAYQRRDDLDRSKIYRMQRRLFDRSTPYTTDVDQIEWDGAVPVGVLELTLRDSKEDKLRRSQPPDGYFAQILNRYDKRDKQGSYVCRVAQLLGCHAFIVVYNEYVDQFWVYRKTDPWTDGWPRGWHYFDVDAYEQFLLDLKHEGRISRPEKEEPGD